MSKTVYVTVGHTAAGKTTLSRMLSEMFSIKHISEGEIKRSLVNNYTSVDSLNENLRDQGYKLAIQRMIEVLNESLSVILDASFHKSYRRAWIYQSLSEASFDHINVVWIYCECPDDSMVRKRISNRKKCRFKHADIQADIFEIYEHINATFDIPHISDFPHNIPSAIIKVNTYVNIIEYTEVSKDFDNSILKCLAEVFFPEYFSKMKAKKNENYMC